MISSTDYNLIAFKAITSFTKELTENFGSNKENHSLKLYDRLISKTPVSSEKAIKKHIDVFRNFCILNRDALTAKDVKKLTTTRVEYSPKVYIDFNNIFKAADRETTGVIWKHLLTISAILDPAGKAKEILKQNKDDVESDFLTDIINKVEEHVKPDSNPMEAVSSIMSSGVFTELISGMNNGIQNGSLDLGKLMGTVQKMVTTLTPNGGAGAGAGFDGEAGMDIIKTMMANMGSNGGGAPDAAQITSMLGPMLAGLGKPPVVDPVPETSTEPVVEEM
jgi:hypothetical protein